MKLHEAVAATFAAVGQEVSDLALTTICKDLAGFPADGVAVALSRCRKELRKIALADILDRIPGGLPGPEEAWALVAPALSDESVSIVWTDEIAAAFGVARTLADDPIAARMAFKEAYGTLRATAREKRSAIVWRPSLGTDLAGREAALLDAAEKGRIKLENFRGLLPNLDAANPRVAALLSGSEQNRLT